MRGQFTAGVLDFFMDKKLFCERVIGVSAGALCGYNYVAGEDGRTCYLNTKYCTDWRYLSMQSFVRTGNACGREFAFDEIPNRLEPFNYAAFDESPMRLVTVASNLVTGEADYHEFADSLADLPYLIASSSMPLVSRHRWRWTAKHAAGRRHLRQRALDVYSLLTGARKAHRRAHPGRRLREGSQQAHGAAAPALPPTSPSTSSACSTRHYEYNRLYRALPRLHDEGRIFVLRPPRARARCPAWRRTPTSCSPSTSRATPRQRVRGPRSCATWRPRRG